MSEQPVETVLSHTLFAKPLLATFDTLQQSSERGPICSKTIDDRLDLTSWLAARLPEWRQAGKVEQDLPSVFHQRCFGIASGYPDANDAAHLKGPTRSTSSSCSAT